MQYISFPKISFPEIPAPPISRQRTGYRGALLLGLAVILVILPPARAVAQILFEDVTAEAGLDYVGESWGASVGYVNADPLPDIFLNRHRNPAALLINQANGTFENRAFEVDAWQAEPHSDQHGGSFADFDNDGDSDLLVTAGARYPSQFLVNNGEFLSDKVQSYTFDRSQWGGRHVTWYDFSRDGRLDMAVAMQGNLMQHFEQNETDFQVINFFVGHECDNNDYALLADMNFDAFQDLVCVKQSQFPEHVYDFSGPYPFIDISSVSDSYANVVDAFVADLDGDLIAEFFGPRGRARIIGAEQVDVDSVEAHLIHQNGTYSTVSFRTTGDVTIAFHWNARNSQNIHIGAVGDHPPGAPPEVPITANLSPLDPDTYGMPPFDPLVDAGIFIGYDPATATWTMVHTSGQRPQESYLYTYIDSTSAISDLDVQGLIPPLDLPREPLLLKYSTTRGVYTHQIAGTGLQVPVKCVSAVAADFDNDMDQDIYMVCRNAVSNAANILYMNDGTGRFTAVADAGGAAGPVGVGFGFGLSEIVVTTDYDVDGFVDLLVTNGLKYFPEEPHSAGGPEKLFRNLGNSNRWIELDLVGVASNRDAVGAIVTVTAGGIAQRREQNGGYHRWSQNDKRLHFGLASNTAANIEVRWPSGQVDNFTAVPANAVYRLSEGSTEPEPVTIPTTVPPSACERTAGAPTIDASAGREIFIWKDSCAATTWHFRLTGGNQPPRLFTGAVRANLPMAGVAGVLLESDDVLNLHADGLQLDYGLTVSGTSIDGFDLTVAEGSNVCAGIGASHSTALIGPDQIRVNLPVNLQTLQQCETVEPQISADEGSALESGSGVMVFDLTLDFAVPHTVTVDYATADGTAVAGEDYTAKAGTVRFDPNTTEATIEIPIIDDSDIEFAESFSLLLSNPVGGTIQQLSVTGTVYDDDAATCGTPTIDPAVDPGLFVWEDCVTGAWTVLASGGGGANRTYAGRVQSDANFESVTPDSIEANDVLDFTTDPAAIDYSLVVGNSGTDGFTFTLATDAQACLALNSPSTPVFVGAQKNPIASPFDLTTLGSCLPSPANLVTTVRQVFGSPKAPAGSAVGFDIAVVNAGSFSADGVSLQAGLPAGLSYQSHTATAGSYDPATGAWAIGTLDAGESATLTVSATVDIGQEGKKIIFAVSAASGTTPDPTSDGDRLEAAVSVPPRRVPVSDGSGGTGGLSIIPFPVIVDRVRFATDFVRIHWLGLGPPSADGTGIRPLPGGAGPVANKPAGAVRPDGADLRLRERRGQLGVRGDKIGGGGDVVDIPRGAESFTISWSATPAVAASDWTAELWRGDALFGIRHSSGLLHVLQGNARLAEETLSPGDVLSIAIDGSRIEYRKNNRIVAAGTIAGTGRYRFHSSIAGATLKLHDLEFPDPEHRDIKH